MLRLLFALSLTIITGVDFSSARQADPWPALVTRAQDVVARLVSGDVEPLFLTFNDKMKAAIDANGLRRLIPSLVVQFGAFKTQNGARTESQGGLLVVLVSCTFERANVDVRVAFDSFDRIVGIGFRPPEPTVAYAAPSYVTPSAFRDEAFIVDAGGWPLQGTLSMPIGPGTFPGVVLVHGSGPNDRDESFGHSLGGMLAPRIATADPSIAGLILMAAAVKPLEQSIVDQTRYLAMLDGKISAEEQAALDSVNKLAMDVRALKPSDSPIVSPPFSAPASYWIDLRGYDPPGAASRLGQPMLVLEGERDYQVTMDDFAAWKSALGSRANVQLKSYPALNHSFIAGSGPSTPAEYEQPGHVDESVVRDIAAWITR